MPEPQEGPRRTSPNVGTNAILAWSSAPLAAIPSTLTLPGEVVTFATSRSRVVDLGCGMGDTTTRMASVAGHVVGVDINAEALRSAARRRGKASYVLASATDLPFSTGGFDLALAQALLTVIPGIDNRRRVFEEARRVIAASGFLILSEFCQNWQLHHYRRRYEDGLAKTGEMGSFVASSGSGSRRFSYVAHHVTEPELQELIDGLFGIKTLRYEQVITATGNRIWGIVAVLGAVSPAR